MIRSPSGLAYRRLEGVEYELFELMDGTRTVRDLVLEYFRRSGSFAFPRVLNLVADLHAAGYLEEAPRPVYIHLASRLRRLGRWQRARQAWRRVISAEFVFKDLDAISGAVYARGGWILFSRPAQAVYAVLAVIGAAAFVRETLHPTTGAFGLSGMLRSAVLLTLLCLLSVFVHESAHALATKAYGRRVRRGGMLLYLGMPTFFVDTTDIWMAERHGRLVVSWSGPLSGFVYGGTCSLLALAMPEAWFAPVLMKAALFCYFTNLLNLMPLLELDGYYILIDLLDLPMLRHRSMSFLRSELWPKFRRREGWSSEEKIFLAFGALAWLYTIYTIGMAIYFWITNVSGFLAGLWSRVPPTAKWGLAVAAVVLLSPLLSDIAIQLYVRGRSLWRGSRGWWRARSAREALSLLESIPWLEGLGPERRAALAKACRPQRVSQGAAIVREGEAGERFYIMVTGEAEVWRRDHPSEPVARVGPGDYFGERALMQSTPRQATVVATAPCRLYCLRREDFQRLLAPQLRVLQQADGLLAERAALAGLPLFRELSSAGIDLLARHLERWLAQPGDVVMRQGEPGDLFYLIEEGEAEVEQDGARVAVLSHGNWFGEVALLWEVPRTATVTALTPLRGWSLARKPFLDVLGSYLDLQGQLVAVATSRQSLRGEVTSAAAPVGRRGDLEAAPA